ncbi:MAG: T9SS type A sorting domain-containing protein [Flavobacteriales bacterium]
MLEPGEHINLLVAYVYARATTGGPQASVTALQDRVDAVRGFVEGIEGMYDLGETAGLACPSLSTDLTEVSTHHGISVYPNPAVDQFILHCTHLPSDAAMEVHDMKGTRVMGTRLTRVTTVIDVSICEQGSIRSVSGRLTSSGRSGW